MHLLIVCCVLVLCLTSVCSQHVEGTWDSGCQRNFHTVFDLVLCHWIRFSGNFSGPYPDNYTALLWLGDGWGLGCGTAGLWHSVRGISCEVLCINIVSLQCIFVFSFMVKVIFSCCCACWMTKFGCFCLISLQRSTATPVHVQINSTETTRTTGCFLFMDYDKYK